LLLLEGFPLATGVTVMPEPGRDATPWAKKKPTVAIFPMDQESTDVLRDCFTRFSIDVSPATDTAILRKEKLEGCVVSLMTPHVEKIVAEARNSAWQKCMVVYAVGARAQLRDLIQYGVNVLLEPPVTRPAAIKAIRSTRLLLLNELRRYVRLPLAAPVTIEQESRRWTATSVEISMGGMSLQIDDHCPPPDTGVSASFAVPGSAQINIASTVCWSDERHRQFGLRFNPAAEDRELIKGWIEAYLGLN
jgi:PilZ domain